MLVEVVCSDMDNDWPFEDPNDIQCTQSVWQKSVQSTPISCTSHLAMIDWVDIKASTLYTVV